jgi:hypothetical protein
MPDGYYVGVDGVTQGPYTLGEINERRSSGKYDDSTPIWHTEKWISLGEFLETNKQKDSLKETTAIEPPFQRGLAVTPRDLPSPIVRVRASQVSSPIQRPVVVISLSKSRKISKPLIPTPATPTPVVQPSSNNHLPENSHTSNGTSASAASPIAATTAESTPSKEPPIDGTISKPADSHATKSEIPTPISSNQKTSAETDATKLPPTKKKSSRFFLWTILAGIILMGGPLVWWMIINQQPIKQAAASRQVPIEDSNIKKVVTKPIPPPRKSIADELAQEEQAAKISTVSGLIQETESASCREDPAKAINLLDAALDFLPDTDNQTYNYIQRKIYSLRLQQGTWSDFTPPQSLDGWTSHGEWSVPTNGILEGSSGAHQNPITINSNKLVEPAFEVEGDIEFLDHSLDKQESAITLTSSTIDEMIIIRLVQNLSEKSFFIISQKNGDEIFSTQRDLHNANHILIKFTKDHLTCALNKETIFDKPISDPKGSYLEKLKLGYRNDTQGSQHVIRYRNFRLCESARDPESKPEGTPPTIPQAPATTP